MTPTTMELLGQAGLQAQGPVRWGEPIPSRGPGVYVVEGPSDLWTAPLSTPAIEAWLGRVPGIRVDGVQADARSLAMRLDAFWIHHEPVLYVGRAGTDVGSRVRAYYRTPLGNPRPHAGGQWLKALSILDDLRVWWADNDDPTEAEARLLDAFADRHEVGMLPFANRQDADGVRKDHGITGSTLARRARPSITSAGRSRLRAATPTTRSATGLAKIRSALRRFACADPAGEVTAVEAAAELDRLGLLRDSPDRPGFALRRLLRDGRIENARQEAGRWWFIDCPHR